MTFPIIELFLRTLFLYGVFSAIGYVFKRVAAGKTLQNKIQIPNALIGIVIVQIWYWHISTLFHVPTDRGTVPVVLIMVGSALLILLRNKQRRYSEWPKKLLVTLGSIGLFAFQVRGQFTDGFFRSSSPNNDILTYAQIAQHMAQQSVFEVGRISGLDGGLQSRIYSGPGEIVAFARVVMNANMNQTLLPVLCLAILIIAEVVYTLLSITTNLKKSEIVILSLVPQTAFMVVYLGHLYFLPQLIATALFVALFTIYVSIDSEKKYSPKEFFTTALFGGILIAGLSFTYSHIVFVVVPFIAAIVVPCRQIKISIFRLSNLITATFFGALFSLGKIPYAIDKLLETQQKDVSGWPLGLLLPSHLIGLQFEANSRIDLMSYFVSAVLVFLWFSSIRKMNKLKLIHPRLNLLVFFIFLSYVAVYLRYGDSYQQWKWITYFQPLVIVGLISPIILVISIIYKRHLWVGLAFLCLLIAVNTVATSQLNFEMTADRTVDSELVNLQKNSELRGIQQLNIKTGPFFKSMWPAFYLDQTDVAILDPSYYTASEPLNAPTLTLTTFELLPGVEVRKIGTDYLLVSFPYGKLSSDPSGLRSQINVNCETYSPVVSQKIRCTLSATNTGNSTWLGSGAFRGAVNIGIRTLCEMCHSPIKEIAHIPLTPFPNFIAPNTSFVTDFEFTLDETGKQNIEFGLISEQVSWFADLSSLNSVKKSFFVR